MKTVHQIRRDRLEDLIKQHNDSLADLNQALGYARNDAKLSRIRNRNERKDHPGKFFDMGPTQARYIETTLGLEVGLMDTPTAYTGEYSGGPVSTGWAASAHQLREEPKNQIPALDEWTREALAIVRSLKPHERPGAVALLRTYAVQLGPPRHGHDLPVAKEIAHAHAA